jgi:hypothetical protein
MTNDDRPSLRLSVKLCSDKAAYEVRTGISLHLNMGELKNKLDQFEENKIIVYTPHMIIFKTGGAEITLSKDGRMLIKRVTSETEATHVAQRLLPIVLKSAF